MSRRITALRIGFARLDTALRAARSIATAGVFLALVVALAPATTARAADVMLDVAVADAKASRFGASLLDVPFYMAGEKHPAVTQKIGIWPTDKRTNAFGKAKTDACHRVFVSAIRALQQRAQREGGNAVIDIESTIKGQSFKSATQFRCAAGGVMANVVLKGTIVKLAGK